MIYLPAYAKVNLSLEVLGKRSNGYHEIITVLQTISLKDEVYLKHNSFLKVEYNPTMEFGSRDLVFKGIRLLERERGKNIRALISIQKRIPVALGLGGGSSDAIAAVKGLNKLLELGLSKESLIRLSLRIGSDCPFFLIGGTALAQGRGEKITPLPPLPHCFFILLFPQVPIPKGKTRIAYEKLSEKDFSEGKYSLGLVESLKRGRPRRDLLFNAFEQISETLFPGLSEFKALMLKAGASSVHLSGTGPVLFTLEEDEEKASFILEKLISLGARAIIAKPVRADEIPLG